MKKTTILTIALLVSLVLPIVCLSAGEPATVLAPEPEGGYGICDLFDLINNGVSIFVKVLIPLFATLVLAYAGFKMLTNQGNSEVAKQVKGITLAVAIGVVVMFASYAIVGMVLHEMGTVKYSTDANGREIVNPLDWAPKCER